ncbi:MAG: hypothetical protein CM1200mP24_05780 [Gammaproteobacteria bacterium]|nr:MAG: hypothetical protein CM1200mP24_05780 [Gammaproteobacteria bacterium]
MILVSLDIDGTWENLGTPGPLTLNAVRKALEMGVLLEVVGSTFECTKRSICEA